MNSVRYLSIFISVQILWMSTDIRAQSLYPCTQEQYTGDRYYSIPTVDQLHSDVKVAFRQGDKDLALTIMCQAALAGSSEAEYMLGTASEEGPLGIEKDFFQARYWLQPAVSKDHLLAHYRLALLYLEGRGGKMNSEKGIRLLRTAAEKNCLPAQTWLAYEYTQGKHLNRNIEMAYYWANRAVEAGHPRAEELLDIINDMLKMQR